MKKLLLDENLPTDLRLHFSSDFEVYTVKYCGWSALQNGKLLTEMKENGFYALITADKNLQFQQNLEKYGIKVVVLNCENTLLKELIPFITPAEQELRKEDSTLAILINKD